MLISKKNRLAILSYLFKGGSYPAPPAATYCHAQHPSAKTAGTHRALRPTHTAPRVGGPLPNRTQTPLRVYARVQSVRASTAVYTTACVCASAPGSNALHAQALLVSFTR